MIYILTIKCDFTIINNWYMINTGENSSVAEH